MLPFWTEMGLARIEAAGLWLNPRCVNTDENLTVPITSKSGYKQKSWCGINKTRSWSPRHRRAGTRGQLASHSKHARVFIAHQLPQQHPRAETNVILVPRR